MKPSALAERYLLWLRQEAAAARTAPKTVDYYVRQLGAWQSQLGLFPPEVEDLIPADLIGTGGQGRNRIQAVKRLTRWGWKMGLLPSDPFEGVALPAIGERERTLSRQEMVALYLASTRPWRRYLFVARHTIARPGEVRTLRWEQIDLEKRFVVLTSFKAKRKRRDGLKVRLIPLDLPTVRLLGAMRRRMQPKPSDYVFLSARGAPLTVNAVRQALRRARRAAGLDEDDEESVCAYTIRHTAATEATRHGLRDRQLADVMGHTSTRTTARYQHLAGDDLVSAIDDAREKEAARRRK